MSDVGLYGFLVALMLLATGFVLVGGVLVLGCVYKLTDALWNVGERVRRWIEIRREVREAKRILDRCQELDLDVEQVLTLEAYRGDESRVD